MPFLSVGPVAWMTKSQDSVSSRAVPGPRRERHRARDAPVHHFLAHDRGHILSPMEGANMELDENPFFDNSEFLAG